MQCPQCQALMVEGRVELHPRRVRTRLLGGRVDNADLHFTDRNGAALYPKVGHRGQRCPKCDTVVVLGEALETGLGLACFECGAPIADDADRCGKCGWTWK
ncbi:MAG: hypothetical protein IT373_08680 [Polyangiaceae bacterium]|nr:hypothetical protein [Polyangiaceae bacterium]